MTQRWCDLCDRDAVQRVLSKGTNVRPIMISHFCADHRSEMLEHAEKSEGVVVPAEWTGSVAAAARLIVVNKVMKE